MVPIRGIASIVVALLAACGGGVRSTGPVAPLRPACGTDQRWDGKACRPAGDARARVATAVAALDAYQKEADLAKFDAAQTALARVEDHGPLDHDTHVRLWEQRGIAAAFKEDEPGASRAFDMVLALDPGHLLSYMLSPKATFVFERVRASAIERGAPGIDVSWAQGQKVGAPVPLEVEVVADPKRFLRKATVYVRARGERDWRAADVTLPAAGKRAQLRLPATDTDRPTALEVYARAYDDRGNEVLTWADARRPREIPLRYDPPPPWYRKPWVWMAIVGGAASITAVSVYAATRSPSSTLETPPITTQAR